MHGGRMFLGSDFDCGRLPQHDRVDLVAADERDLSETHQPDGDPIDDPGKTLVTPERLHEVAAGIDKGQELVYEAMLFYMLAPADILVSMRCVTALSKVDNVKYLVAPDKPHHPRAD